MDNLPSTWRELWQFMNEDPRRHWRLIFIILSIATILTIVITQLR